MLLGEQDGRSISVNAQSPFCTEHGRRETISAPQLEDRLGLDVVHRFSKLEVPYGMVVVVRYTTKEETQLFVLRIQIRSVCTANGLVEGDMMQWERSRGSRQITQPRLQRSRI